VHPPSERTRPLRQLAKTWTRLPYNRRMGARLTAIVPATDRPPTLARVVTAIRSSAQAPEEVLVVEEPAGLGPAAARNLAARRANGELLVFVDADVEVHPDAFARIRSAFAADGELTALFGSYDDDPPAGRLVSDFRNLLHHHVHQTDSGPATTFWAGLGAIRRDAFLEAGGFDERRFPRPSIEDIDLGARLVAQGEYIVLDPLIQGKHLKHWTVATMVKTDLFDRGLPWVELLISRGVHETTLNLGWRHRASAAASLLFVTALLTRRPRRAAVALSVLCALNAPFYLLLFRRRGWRQAAAGVPLHVLHHLTGGAALPVGAALHLRRRLRRSGA
jgi:hypothetical protein